MSTFIKIGLAAIIVAAVAEIAKRSTVFGALVASLPLTSILAMIWLYRDTHDTARVAVLSSQIFWLVLPSLALFIVLPLMIKRGLGFYPSLGIAVSATVIAYGLVVVAMQRLANQG